LPFRSIRHCCGSCKIEVSAGEEGEDDNPPRRSPGGSPHGGGTVTARPPRLHSASLSSRGAPCTFLFAPPRTGGVPPGYRALTLRPSLRHLRPGKFPPATGRSRSPLLPRGTLLFAPPRTVHVSPFSAGPALPAGSSVIFTPLRFGSPAAPVLSARRRGAAMTRRTARLAAPAPDLQSPSTATKAWSALHSEPGLYQIQLAVKYRPFLCFALALCSFCFMFSRNLLFSSSIPGPLDSSYHPLQPPRTSAPDFYLWKFFVFVLVIKPPRLVLNPFLMRPPLLCAWVNPNRPLTPLAHQFVDGTLVRIDVILNNW